MGWQDTYDEEGVPQVCGFPDPFPPGGAILFSGDEGFGEAGVVSGGEPGMTPSAAEEPFTIGG